MKGTTNAAVPIIALVINPLISVVSAQPYDGCDIATYYSPLPVSPIDADRNDVHKLIKDTHRNQLPYSSGSYGDVWDALIALDSDASGQNVRLIYANTLVSATPYDSGTCEYWNREHLWSRSRGVGSSGMDNTDMHHLRPSDCNVNSARNNLYFGACGTGAPLSECDTPAHAEAAADTEKDPVSFLPPADRRGDVARAILYMDLRYDGDEGSTTMDLVVSDCPETVPGGAGMGYLSQLLQWHLDDPPDDEEKQRNEKVCTDWQGNRNPFVDYPDLASIYHGGSRPLLGDGLGYDCTVPPPPAPPRGFGTCSDDTLRSCASTDECLCATAGGVDSSIDGKLRALSYIGNQQKSIYYTKHDHARKMDASLSKLIITGVIDGPLTGGLPKAIELYALHDIANLSAYGIGSANNGLGTDGQEFTLSGSASAGSFITVASEAAGFDAYFAEPPTFTDSVAIINGDDAIELFFEGAVVDTFGDIDSTGQAWRYENGWAYRKARSTPGGSLFELSEWTFSSADAVNGCTDNGSCASSFPYKSFVNATTPPPTPIHTSKPTASVPECECSGLEPSQTLAPSPRQSGSPSNSASGFDCQSLNIQIFTSVIIYYLLRHFH